MPLVSTTSLSEIVSDMINCQVSWGLSEKQFGDAILGPVADSAKTVRGWKTGTIPTPPAIQSFLYLKALVSIANNSPLSDAEENYRLAFAALPEALQ